MVIVGMHGSGKTTAASYLTSFGYLAHAELGWAYRQGLRLSGDTRPTLVGADLAWFDSAIVRLERERDTFIARATEVPHCVETWHLGNLAYASMRSPSLRSTMEEALLDGIRAFNPLFVVLSITRDQFVTRCHLQDAPVQDLHAFYAAIDDLMMEYVTKYKLEHILVNNCSEHKDLYAALGKMLNLPVDDAYFRAHTER
ncbi:MAG: DEAD/DEAH box helicase family protein [Vulcanimicrobiaceae bacterium]